MTTTRGPDFPAAVDLARSAPSVHNTQPWRFAVRGDVLTLSADLGRQLAMLDRSARQLTISCGAALHLTRLGLRQQGFDTQVEVHEPVAGSDPTLLATVRAVPGSPATAEEVALAHAATRRHMHRAPFEDRPVTDDAVTAMREAVVGQGAWVRFLRDPAEQVPLTVLLSRAEEAEREDPAYLAELAAWTPEDGAVEGVPAAARGADRAPRASTLRLREFAAGPQGPVSGSGFEQPPPAEHPLVAVIGTGVDSRRDWLAAGEALSALLLQGAVHGVAASPLGQVLDLDWTRARLTAELGVRGQPQMVLRLGYAPPGPDTPRRPLDQVLDPDSDA